MRFVALMFALISLSCLFVNVYNGEYRIGSGGDADERTSAVLENDRLINSMFVSQV